MRQNLSAFCADGNAVGIAEFKFFARKILAGLFLIVRAQILGPTCADGSPYHMAHARAMPSAQAVPSFFYGSGHK
jgi:hypothetical protein